MKLTILDPKTGQHYRATLANNWIMRSGGTKLLFKILVVGVDITHPQFLNMLNKSKLEPITLEEAAMLVSPKVNPMPTSNLSYRRVRYKQRKKLSKKD